MTDNIVILPTDGSEFAEAAFEVGFGLAEKLGATVHAISVGDIAMAERSSVGGSGIKSKEDVTEIAAEWADELAARARDYGLDAEPVVRSGTPAQEIAEYAAEIDAEMIVIGTAGRNGIERTILGSVTDKVVRTAPVPVVTVRPDGTIDAA